MTTTEELAPLDNIDLDGTDRPLNPVEVEAGIRKCARLIHYGIRIVSDAEAAHRGAVAEYDRAYARAYLAADGAQYARRYHAELATEAERDARDIAELAYRHAERRQRALLAQLDAARSVNASVRGMYGAESGIGR